MQRGPWEFLLATPAALVAPRRAAFWACARRPVAGSDSGLLVLGVFHLGLLVEVGGGDLLEPGLLGVGEQLEQLGLLLALELRDLLPEGVDLVPVVGADL